MFICSIPHLNLCASAGFDRKFEEMRGFSWIHRLDIYLLDRCDLYFEPLWSLCVMDDLYTLKE